MTEEELKTVADIIEGYRKDPGMLIPIMQDIQAEEGYLPRYLLEEVSDILHLPLSRVYSVARFYSSFQLAPQGQHEVTICMGTVCHLKGADRISEAICEEFKVEPGGTTPDRFFTLKAVNCVGACALAPVVVIDGEYHDHMTPGSTIDVLRELPVGEDETEENSDVEAKSEDN